VTMVDPSTSPAPVVSCTPPRGSKVALPNLVLYVNSRPSHIIMHMGRLCAVAIDTNYISTHHPSHKSSQKTKEETIVLRSV
jgi:hypothetical protein